jgi:Fe-S cluster assembly protein SufD
MRRLEETRAAAGRRFAELGFPTTRDEEWRFTNVSPIASTRFQEAPAPARLPDQVRARAETLRWGGLRLVFVNGRLAPDLSTVRLPKGVVAGSLLAANGTAAQHLARYARYEDHAFVAWNTASFADGAYVEIPKGVALEEPIELLFLTAGSAEPVVAHPRVLIVAGPQSQASIVEVYAGAGGRYLTNAVTEIVAADSAVLDHYRLQLDDEQAFHVSTVQAQVGRDTTLTTVSIALGAELARQEVNAVLAEGASAWLNGLYVIGGVQHTDHHTVIDHARPHGTSFELYKGILDGRSSAVFNGRIIVRPEAQKTDSKQTNKNLVLSEDATINTKPELRIFADDVRCTHGATIGQLDPEAIFYLESRGIAQEEARELLTHAFARDLIERIRFQPLAGFLDALLWERLHDRRN